jgi:mRNA-degrading endonuclease RelE of RelBE toxin-antitoxin system
MFRRSAARRLRIGDYRVLFSITAAQIEVIAVRHRKDAYI